MTAAPLLDDISPMLLMELKQPPSDESNFIAEIKFDGYRVMAEFGGGKCFLKSRNGADCTTWFAEVSETLAAIKCGRVVIDGEMCILDAKGRSDFELLHSRARRRKYVGGPMVTYCVFDILVADGESLLDMPLIDRKHVLESFLSASLANVLYTGHIDQQDHESPVTWLYQQAVKMKLEGVVAKRKDSIYQPGVRSKDWIKVKRPGAIRAQRFKR